MCTYRYMHKTISLILSHKARMYHRRHKSFQPPWQTYLATGSVADLAQRPERRVITARQDIHIILFYMRRRLVTARSMSQTIFWIQGRQLVASSPDTQKQGHATYAKYCTSATRAALQMLLDNNFSVLDCPVWILNKHVWVRSTVDADHSVMMFMWRPEELA